MDLFLGHHSVSFASVIGLDASLLKPSPAALEISFSRVSPIEKQASW